MFKLDFNDNWYVSKDNKKFKSVTLPYDAMIYESRDKDNLTGSGCAYFNGGIYTYKKTFKLDKDLINKHLVIYFEGAYKNTTVKLNGKTLGFHPYGYTGFYYDLDEYVFNDKENELEVICDNSKTPNSRWYSGSGIYRPVYLLVSDINNYFDLFGIRVETISINPCRLKITSNYKKNINTLYYYEIIFNNEVVYKGNEEEIELKNYYLWDSHNPNLYTIKAYLKQNDNILDVIETKFGIRTIKYNMNGLFINDKKTLLKGGCIHHDNGVLGANSYKEAEYRKIAILKSHGFNAIRSAHNPISEYTLMACDELGMYIMDEAFDMWYSGKNPFDYSLDFNAWYEKDIKYMCDHDFNHPSVIMYSIGNEISDPVTLKGKEMAKKLYDTVKKYDNTRGVTAGINHLNLLGAYGCNDRRKKECDLIWNNDKKLFNSLKMYNKYITKLPLNMQSISNSKLASIVAEDFCNTLDIAGYNYASTRYPYDYKRYPNRVIVGTETFAKDIYKNWQMIKKYPNVIGDFVWVAMDYLGEAGLGLFAYNSNSQVFSRPCPSLLGESGVIDLIGNPNGESGLFHVAWDNLENPEIYINPIRMDNMIPAKAGWRWTDSKPSYSYRGCDGKKCHVLVFSKPGYVMLKQNNKLVKKAKVKNGFTEFDLLYEPGEITAYSYNKKKELIGSSTLRSSSGNLYIDIKLEEKHTDDNIYYLDISLIDSNNIVEANMDTLLTANIIGGKILGFGSANPITLDSFVENKYHTYFGHALAVVKKIDDNCIITIKGENLESKTFKI